MLTKTSSHFSRRILEKSANHSENFVEETIDEREALPRQELGTVQVAAN